MTRTAQYTATANRHGEPLRLVIYARISDDPHGGGVNADTQVRRCHERAAAMGAVVVAVKRDDDRTAMAKNGKRAERPAFDETMAMLINGEADGILCLHTDRLYRHSVDLEPLVDVVEKTGAMIFPLMTGELDLTTATGRIIARILAAVATGEVERAIERMKDKKDANRRAGIQSGGPRPYGYCATKPTPKGMPPEVQKINKREADWIRFASVKVLAGSSLRSVCAAMNAGGARTPKGNTWSATTLKQCLTSMRLAGLIEHDGAIIGPATWDAILTESDVRTLRRMLSDPARRTSAGNSTRWLLSGIAVCGMPGCGQPLKAGGKNRTGQHTYRCPESSHVTRACGPLDEYVSSSLVDHLIRTAAVDTDAGAPPDDGPDLEAEATRIRTRMTALADAFADEDDADPVAYRAASARLRDRLADVERRMAERVVTASLDDVEDYGLSPEEFWPQYTLEKKRALVAARMTVTVLPAKKGRPAGHVPGTPYFDTAAVRIEWKPVPAR